MKLFNCFSEIMQQYGKPYALVTDLTCNESLTVLVEEENIKELQEILKEKCYKKAYYYNILDFICIKRIKIIDIKNNCNKLADEAGVINNTLINLNINPFLKYPNFIRSNTILKLLLKNTVTYNSGDYFYKVLHPVDYFIYVLFLSNEEINVKHKKINLLLNEYLCDDFLDDLKKRMLFLIKEGEAFEKYYREKKFI